ncbi:hypothetical protein [Bradyrhizobium centrosematis]|uniref:hypothetical protein n=1 Tax=Bradyrhizobium centrosematis TaxID=1300039 RepID=UPI0038910201
MISKDLLGCATARNKGTCNNRLNIRRDALETSVLSGLRTHMMEPELFKEFCDEFTREVNRPRINRGADVAAMGNELPRIERELGKLVAAIKAGGPIEAIVEDMKRLGARKVEVREKLAKAEEPPPLLHSNRRRSIGSPWPCCTKVYKATTTKGRQRRFSVPSSIR